MGHVMPETVESLRWRVGCSVDGKTYRYLIDLCQLHSIDLPDLIGYLLLVGMVLSAEDLRVLAPREVPCAFN
jgi:hypothetical protein